MFTAKKLALSILLLGFAIVTVEASSPVGIVITKKYPWGSSSDIGQIYEYSALVDHTGYLTLTTLSGQEVQVKSTVVVDQIVYPKAEDFPELITTDDLASIQTAISTIQDKQKAVPGTGKYLAPIVQQLESEVQKYQSGMLKTDGRWVSKSTYDEQVKEQLTEKKKEQAEQQVEEKKEKEQQAQEQKARAAAIAKSQAEAAKQFPDLMVKGSALNQKFVALVNERRESNPAFFNQANWPMVLAQEASSPTPEVESDGDQTIDQEEQFDTKISGMTEEKASEVRRSVIGTWTYTGQGYEVMEEKVWEKWVFKSNGTMEEYSARPMDDNWGEPETIHKWKPITAKYENTGRRYYGVEVDNWLKYVIIKDNGNLRFHPSSETDIEFTKGDCFPFSK